VECCFEMIQLYVKIECRNCNYLRDFFSVLFCRVLSMCCLVVSCVLTVYCLFVIYLGCGMWFEVMYSLVGSGCRDRNDFYNEVKIAFIIARKEIM